MVLLSVRPPVTHAVQQFVALKMRMLGEAGTLGDKRLLSLQSFATLSELISVFETVWATVLGWCKASFGEVQTIIEVSLCSMDCTAVIEGGWSQVNFLKGIHRLSLHGAQLDSLMHILLNGPPPHQWDPQPAMESWYTAGKRRKRSVMHVRKKVVGCKGKRAKEAEPGALEASVREILGCWVPTEGTPEGEVPATVTLRHLEPCTSEDDDTVSEFGSESDSASASEFVPDQGTTATSSADTDVPVRRARTRASERGKKRAGRDARYGVV